MDTFIFDVPEVVGVDFAAHNEAQQQLWEAFRAGNHHRAPVRLGTNPRMLMLDPQYNTRGISYESYFTDPEIMGQGLLEWQYWTRHHLPGDTEYGLPESWECWIDFQNVYDAVWFGAPVYYRDRQVPCAMPFLDDDNKRMIFDKGTPEPFEGEWAQRALDYLAFFRKKSEAGWAFRGRPVAPPSHAPFAATDGVFTTAACLRGATGLCEDLLCDPDYAHELLAFVFEGIVNRVHAWREVLGYPESPEAWGTADDSIELLSVEQYREFVLPLHKRLFDALGTKTGRGIHLCGDAQRLFPVIQAELGVSDFDTGFPVDFGRMRRELGPDTLIQGGPRVPLFLKGTPDDLVQETKRILCSGVLEGGKFILREANNLAPCASLAACRAFYETGKHYGILA